MDSKKVLEYALALGPDERFSVAHQHLNPDYSVDRNKR